LVGLVTDLFILTGAPGSGKSTILDALGGDIRVMGEPAREILAEQRATDGDGVHDRDRTLFVALLLQRSIDKYEAAQHEDGPVMFDRGIPDCIAYAELMDLDPTPSLEAAETHGYHHEVLILEPWEAIYDTDDERTMSFEQTHPFHDALVDAYTRTGYSLVVVPTGPVEDRAAFVREFIEARST
jgi:predicted ATPase